MNLSATANEICGLYTESSQTTFENPAIKFTGIRSPHLGPYKYSIRTGALKNPVGKRSNVVPSLNFEQFFPFFLKKTI